MGYEQYAAAIDFNPLPSCEGRPTRRLTIRSASSHFNPLPSCEGRLRRVKTGLQVDQISIHSPHARGDTRLAVQSHRWVISIHSPHARGDGDTDVKYARRSVISIHSPHARGDRVICAGTGGTIYFNPLPSCEGRPARAARAGSQLHFNPLPSCEGRLNSS